MRRATPEDHDPQARAQALEALRMRLDPSADWPDERSWLAIAQTLGYPSADAAKRAAWRTFNRTAYDTSEWQTVHTFVTLAEAVGLTADVRTMREALRDLDARRVPEDRDPPKPRKPRPLSKTALRRMLKERIAAERNTVDADPQATALLPAPDRQNDT